MTNEQEVRAALARITRLLAAQVGSDLKVTERAPLLHRLGVDRATIAVVCGTSPEVVSVRVAESRRGAGGSRRTASQTKGRAGASV